MAEANTELQITSDVSGFSMYRQQRLSQVWRQV